MLSKTIVVLYRPREPFEIAALILCLLSVVMQGIDGAPPGSASAEMPLLFQWIWLILVGFGSFVALAGIALWHRALTGIVAEAIGLSAVAAGLALNGIGAVMLAVSGEIGSRSAIAGPLSLSLAWCAWIRMRRVRREIKNVEAASAEQEHLLEGGAA